jgi:hypothetical protein
MRRRVTLRASHLIGSDFLSLISEKLGYYVTPEISKLVVL